MRVATALLPLVVLVASAAGAGELSIVFSQADAGRTPYELSAITARPTDTRGKSGMKNFWRAVQALPDIVPSTKLEFAATVKNRSTNDTCYLNVDFFDRKGVRVFTSTNPTNLAVLAAGQTGIVQWSDWMPDKALKKAVRGDITLQAQPFEDDLAPVPKRE